MGESRVGSASVGLQPGFELSPLRHRTTAMSNHYLLPCSCGQKLRVAAAQAGGEVACDCGRRLTVPTLRGLRELEPAIVEAAGKRVPGWSAIHGFCFSGGILLSIVGAALVAYHLFQYSQVAGYTVDETDKHVAVESAQIDQMSAEQLFAVWKEVLDQGLGEKGMTRWGVARQIVAANRFWIGIGGVATATGLLMSVLSLFIARPKIAA